MSYKSDIEIAREARKKPIQEMTPPTLQMLSDFG